MLVGSALRIVTAPDVDDSFAVPLRQIMWCLLQRMTMCIGAATRAYVWRFLDREGMAIVEWLARCADRAVHANRVDSAMFESSVLSLAENDDARVVLVSFTSSNFSDPSTPPSPPILQPFTACISFTPYISFTFFSS